MKWILFKLWVLKLLSVWIVSLDDRHLIPRKLAVYLCANMMCASLRIGVEMLKQTNKYFETFKA